MQTVILRHQRENLKKCSLRGLEAREDMLFIKYPCLSLPPLSGHIVLSVDAPPLSINDAGSPLVFVDATWRLAKKMEAFLDNEAPGLIKRSIPHNFKTAYPRKQTECSDPERGLATVEAIYISYKILGRPVEGLLDFYHWKEPFLELTRNFL